MTREQLRSLGEYALRARAEYDSRPADDRAETEQQPATARCQSWQAA